MTALRAVTFFVLAALYAAASQVRAESGDDLFRTVGASTAKLNSSGYRTLPECTAVQAGVRSALVPDDCLDEGRFDRAYLLFGYDRQTWTEHRTAMTAYADPDFLRLKLLCLDRALSESKLALAPEHPYGGDRVFIAAYVPPKLHRLTVRSCTVDDRPVAGGFVLGCLPGKGLASGAVFTLTAAGARLLGVVAGEVDGKFTVMRWSGRSPDALCPPKPEQTASEEHG